jgi:hypothetical protein
MAVVRLKSNSYQCIRPRGLGPQIKTACTAAALMAGDVRKAAQGLKALRYAKASRPERQRQPQRLVAGGDLHASGAAVPGFRSA